MYNYGNFFILELLMKQENFKKNLYVSADVTSLIERLSKKYIFTGAGRDDLTQEGWLAVVQEHHKWSKMEPGAQHAYLAPFIRRAMLDYSVANNRIVRIVTTRRQKKALFNLRHYTDGNTFLSHQLEQKIAMDLEVSVRDVRTAYIFLFNHDDHCSVHATDGNTPKQLTISEESTIAGLGNLSEEQSELEALYVAMDDLSERQVEVVNSRWLNDTKKTRKVISKDIGVTEAGIRYIESEALLKLRNNITQNMTVNFH